MVAVPPAQITSIVTVAGGDVTPNPFATVYSNVSVPLNPGFAV